MSYEKMYPAVVEQMMLVPKATLVDVILEVAYARWLMKEEPGWPTAENLWDIVGPLVGDAMLARERGAA